MDHGRLDPEKRQNDERKIIVRGNDHAITWRAGVLVSRSIQNTVGVLRASHYRREEYPAFLCGADGDVEIVFIISSGSVRVNKTGNISQEKSDDDTAGLIFDGRDAGRVDLWHSAAVTSIKVLAITIIEVTGGRIANAKPG